MRLKMKDAIDFQTDQRKSIGGNSEHHLFSQSENRHEEKPKKLAQSVKNFPRFENSTKIRVT